MPFFLGKGRRHSGELDKQQLMILYGVFTMRVRSFRWLTSDDGECVEAWDLFLTKSVVFMHLLRKKISTLLQEMNCGTVLGFKISDIAWK